MRRIVVAPLLNPPQLFTSQELAAVISGQGQEDADGDGQVDDALQGDDRVAAALEFGYQVTQHALSQS